MEITIAIGLRTSADTITEHYEIFETTAPEQYDGGGTFELARYDDRSVARTFRLIAVPQRTIEWQKGRNASGLYATVPHDPDGEDSRFWGVDERRICERLFARLIHPSPEE